ncbi:MAG: hypothetical protein RL338_893 [Chloroflexota bacterium]
MRRSTPSTPATPAIRPLVAAALALLVALPLALAPADPVEAARRPKPTPTATPTPVPSPTPAYLEGIDVSVWQGAIDWSQVAAAGKRFAIVRASAGSLTADTRYAANRTGARRAGIPVGAYHFANPDRAANDALNEANWFLANASISSGDMIPALDVEVTNGLSAAEMQAWVSTWLERVRTVTGVRPMIYTSPSFWASALGDTRQFADAGYTVLWIAHWGASAPTVPAANWGGKGWTFWQYSSTGVVPGISGDVDLDRFRGSSLPASLFVP